MKRLALLLALTLSASAIAQSENDGARVTVYDTRQNAELIWANPVKKDNFIKGMMVLFTNMTERLTTTNGTQEAYAWTSNYLENAYARGGTFTNDAGVLYQYWSGMWCRDAYGIGNSHLSTNANFQARVSSAFQSPKPQIDFWTPNNQPMWMREQHGLYQIRSLETP